MNEVIQVSSTEEYFAEDRDQVYCKHGTYIGYPGGPDFICGACEDGLDTLCTGLQIDLEIRYRKVHNPLIGEDNEPWSKWIRLDRVYSLGGIRKFTPFIEVAAKSPLQAETQIILGTYQFWGPNDSTN